jgi:subtilisin family serine protease
MKLRHTIFYFIITLLVGWLIPAAVSGAVKIDAQLLAMIDSAASDGFVEAIVVLAGGDQISMETSVLARKRGAFTERYQTAYQQLQRKTVAAQAELIKLLQNELASGAVTTFKPYWITNMIYLRATSAVIEQLAGRDDVAQIISDLPVGLIEPVGTSAAAAAQVGAAENLVAVGARALWDRGLTGSGRLICSFDTGVKGSHAALYAKWRGNYTTDTAACWFDPYGTMFPDDASGHGTHVMGIMVGHDGADTIGLAPDARWISAAVIDRGKALPQTMSDILSAFQWAANPDGDPRTMDDVPDVVCNSWGIPTGFMQPCDQKFWEAIDNLESLGIVCIFAAGNEGPNSMTIRNPATRTSSLVNTFSVGSVDATDSELPVASFSSRGPSPCDFADKKPEVVAPGVAIRSSYKDGDYKLINGTSMSAPHVAAAVALFRQYNPDLTPEQIKSAILVTAIDVDQPGEDNESGMGFIDLAAAFELLPASTNPEPHITDILFAEGGNDLLDPRETGNLIVALHGDVAGATSVIGYLSSIEPGIRIDKDTAYFGDLAVGGERDNSSDPFIISTDSSLPLGDTVHFTLSLAGSGITGHLQRDFYIVLGVPHNGRWNTLDFGAVALTVSNFGMLGLHPDSYVPLGGRGYDVPAAGGNHLYEAALVLGAGDDVSDAMRNGVSGKYNVDFKPASPSPLDTFVPGLLGDQQVNAEYADIRAENPLGVTVRQHAAAFGAAPGDRCIIMEYTLINDAGADLNGLHVGLFSDWDFPGDLGGEKVTLDAAEDLFYHYLDLSSPTVGVVLLNAPLGAARFYANESGKRGFSDTEKMQSITEGVIHPDENTAADWCGFIGAGPYDLAQGDSVTVTFALCSGASVAEFYAAAATARNRYSITTDVTDDETNRPREYDLVLYQNYPNPFNPETRIDFAVSAEGPVAVAIYDILGRKIATLFDEYCPAGNHSVTWNGTDDAGRPVASGIYLTRAVSTTGVAARKMVLLR